MDAIRRERRREVLESVRAIDAALASQNYTDARHHLRRSSHVLRMMASMEPHPAFKAMFQAALRTIETLSTMSSSDGEEAAIPLDTRDAAEVAEDEEFAKLVKHPCDVHALWSDVVGNVEAITALQQAVFLPLQYPHLFTGSVRPWRVLLLFGPPGTGKTMIAHAIAKEADCPLICLTASDLLSKWLGESEKCVRHAFHAARRMPRCILFFDEIDALFHTRGEGGESESARRVKTEFLIRLQEFLEDKGTGAMLLAATNLPWDLDPAFRRRFEQMIYVPLPEAPARRTFLARKLPGLSGADLDATALALEGYSCSDMENVVRHASMVAIMELQQAVAFKQSLSPQGGWVPCSPEDPEAVHMAAYQMPSRGDIRPRGVAAADVALAMTKYPRSVSSAVVHRYTEWTTTFA